MNWYLDVLKNYATFGGRARRKEFWFFTLFNVLISIGLTIIDGITGLLNAAIGIGVLSGLYSLAVLIPSIAVTARRLHDTDRSGWWILIAFLPIIGAIVLLVFMVLEGTSGDNQYGADPKAQAA